MFEHHFGLRENPFVAGHHAKFVYPSPEHQEALAHLRYGIENREPFVLITGEVGTGKTTALYDALAEWQNRVVVALITNSALNRNELLEEIALRFGVPINGPASKPQILAHLEKSLLAIHRRGDRAILLLDEAQNLDRDVLEELRLLSNLELDGAKLVQLFLVGQPELETKLQSAALRQLRQRITVHYRLSPLSAEDTEHYIHHRINVAGGVAAEIFPAAACREVHRITHGIPREINTVCSQALLSAFVEDAPAVGVQHVTSAVGELEFESVLEGEDVPEVLRDQVPEAPRPSEMPAAVQEARPHEDVKEHEEAEDDEDEAQDEEAHDAHDAHEAQDAQDAREAKREIEPAGEPEIYDTLDLGGPSAASTQPVSMSAPSASSRPSDEIDIPAEEEEEPAPAAQGDAEFDLNMIDSWMAELEEAKSAEAGQPAPAEPTAAPPAAKAATPAKKSAGAGKAAPAEFVRPKKLTPGASESRPAAGARPVPGMKPAQPKTPEPTVIAAAPRRTPAREPVVMEAAPRRSLANEQRAAMPARLRERLAQLEDDELPPSARTGLPPWIVVAAGVVGVLLVVLLIAHPWSRRSPTPVVASTPAATQIEPTTSAALPAQGASEHVVAHGPAPSGGGAAKIEPSAASPAPKSDSLSHIVVSSSPAPPPARAAVLPPAPTGTPKPGTSGVSTTTAAKTAGATTSKVAGAITSAAKPSARTYTITVATYLESSRAETQRARLGATTGLPSNIIEAQDGGASVYQIVLGRFDTRAAAEKAADDLINRGLIQEAHVIQVDKNTKI